MADAGCRTITVRQPASLFSPAATRFSDYEQVLR